MQVDPALVRACQRGEPGALDDLVRATYTDVYALCRRMLADPHEAADATQEVYVKVVRSIVAFRGESAFTTWLHRVTVNTCLSTIRKRTRARSVGAVPGASSFASPDDARVELLSSDEAGPAEVSERHDLATRAEAALARLPEDARTVVVLRDVEGLSTKEVADLLGITENLVKVRLHRAHQKLRALIEPGASAAGEGA
jgi:RNA polymerase sigma-70 factor (ECF subfamily)